MKIYYQGLGLIISLLFVSSVFAADKVVVIPLGAKAKKSAITRLKYNGETATTETNSVSAQLRTVGNFTKSSGDTFLKVTWISHTIATATGYCNFGIRIDGQTASEILSAANLSGTETIINDESGRTPTSLVEIFEGITAGSHEVSIWVRNTTTCIDNPGNYTRTVLVEEYY